MNIVASFECEPICREFEQKPLSASYYLRTTVVVLGILTALFGILISYGGLSWAHQWGSITGWVFIPVGSLAAIGALSLRCIKQQPHQHIQSSKNENLALVRINEGVLFTPTWYERQLQQGYHRCGSIEESRLNENLDSLLRLSGLPDAKQINIFPLCYNKEENKIFIDLASLLEVRNSKLATIEIDGEVFYTKSSFNPLSLIRQEKSFKYLYTASWSHFQLLAMPKVIFFVAHNGIQLEIGYLNLDDIFGGRDVKFTVNEDNSITILDFAV